MAEIEESNSNQLQKKKHSIIAISGMPAAGKTTLSQELINTMPNLIYFDFGAFFRPITYHLIKKKKMSIEDLQEIVMKLRTNKLMEDLNLGYRNNNRVCEISIDGHFYEKDELYNPEMNKLTVDVGSCFGDSLNKYIKGIIENVRKKNPVLLNARRPFAVCDDISNHIFLKADFYKRAERKAELEETTVEEAIRRLRIRDEKEQRAEFWKIYAFTKIIDTTDKETNETLSIIKEHILRYTIRPDKINKDKNESYK